MKTILAHKTLTFIALVAILAVAAVSIGIASQPSGIPVTGNEPPQVYGNALELQYANPWLAEQNRPAYTHTLEMQYANPWIAKQYQPVVGFRTPPMTDYRPGIEVTGFRTPPMTEYKPGIEVTGFRTPPMTDYKPDQ